MSVRTPTRTTPSEAFSAARVGAAARRIARARSGRWVRIVCLSPGSDAQEAVQGFLPCFELLAPERVHDPAALHEEVTVRQRGDEPEVLLHEDDRVAALLERPDRAPEGLHDHRGGPLGDLVEEEEARAGPEDPAGGEHLLLAAGEARAGA